MSISRRECLRLGLAVGIATVTPFSAIAGRPAPLRLGLWGCDARGLALAVSALRCSADVELVAIADPESARAARAAAWWRHPAQRASLRRRVHLDDRAVLSGPEAANTLAALASVDAVLMADGEPLCAMAHRHVCLWPGSAEPVLLDSLRRASLLATAHDRVLSVCASQPAASAACSGADLRARTLAGFFRDIRQGRSGDAGGQVAALLAKASVGQS